MKRHKPKDTRITSEFHLKDSWKILICTSFILLVLPKEMLYSRQIFILAQLPNYILINSKLKHKKIQLFNLLINIF